MSLFYLFYTPYHRITSVRSSVLMHPLLIAILFLLGGCKATQHNDVAIPSPSDMRSEVSVNGRVSTLKHIDIQYVGKRVPITYSDGKIGNSRGYDWWVSKHFALKSDLPEDKVRLYLELLEMSYPHYVELFGMAPAAIDKKRIAVVYGSSRQRTKEAMLDDGFLRGVHKNAGGETMFYNRAGYNFPSHRQHHQRYIVIHETMHAFHMALNGHSTWAPNWITEGMADAIASHVYDPDKKQLTVMVFDRAPMNYLHLGLQQYHLGGQPSFETINDDPTLKRGLNFFIVHFLLSDPLRYQYFKRFIATLMEANPHSEQTLPTANALLKQTFSNWPQLEKQFAAFVHSATPSFYIVNGPWEQSGAAYWLRNSESKALNRLDIHPNFASNHPVMDFPRPDNTPLIGPQEENSMALLIDFESEQYQRGEIGFALLAELEESSKNTKLGLIPRSDVDFDADHLLQVILQDGVKLTISSNRDQFTSQSIALLPALREDIQAHHQLAISFTKHAGVLALKLSTKNHVQLADFRSNEIDIASVDIHKVSLLGRNNNHKITPYFPQHQYLITKQETPNPWHFEGAQQLAHAFNTCVEYQEQLPDCMMSLDKIFKKQTTRTVTKADQDNLNRLMHSWQATLGNEALFTLSGINVQNYYFEEKHYLYVNNPSEHNVKISFGPNNHTKEFSPGEYHIPLPSQAKQLLTFTWSGLTQRKTLLTPTQVFDGVKMTVKTDNKLVVTITGPYSGKSHGTITVKFTPSNRFESINTIWNKAISFAPYEHKRYELDNVPHLSNGLLEVIGEFDVDGEPLKLVQLVDL
ncbi:hypothetical protein CEX98_08375 [Pseudoalteromonas piscicida]|uniref:Uncharacterized protein n=2 Tax=Pseudoalteromonas piscicida TaxID=43662 RepID=A0A2A5JRY3_PSEO7|nr:hypothetical protein CEX98_08375 [Pseudoalteromonas piscicida]